MSKIAVNRRLTNQKTRLIVSALVAACLATSAVSPALGQTAVGSSNDAPRRPSFVVARVNGIAIHQSDLDRGVAELARNQNIDPRLLPALQANVLQKLIDQALLGKMLSNPKVAPSKKELDTAVDELRGK